MPVPAAVFEQQRPHLLRLAHHMLGNSGDAEDVVQDAFLRWLKADTAEIRTPSAWLVTVVSRIALDRLRAAQIERKNYHGAWLPEPWVHGASFSPMPDAPSERDRALDYAALVLLERLTPEERAAYLLREIFEVDYARVAEALARSEDACRQLVHRARERLGADRKRRSASAAEKADLLQRLHAASQAQDAAALAALFAPNPSFTSDGGGKRFAARDVLHGVERIEGVLLGVARKVRVMEWALLELSGEPVHVAWRDGALYSATFVDADPAGIHNIYRLLNPEKLSRLGLPATPPRR